MLKIKGIFLLAILLFTYLSVPNHVSAATIEELQAQIKLLIEQVEALQNTLNTVQQSEVTTSAEQTFSCNTNTSVVTVSLSKGSTDSETGGQVTKLQVFLASDPEVYPEGLITGYFGLLTEQAVKNFQKKHTIVSSGSPESTGYGVVGPKTRAELNTTTTCIVASLDDLFQLEEGEQAILEDGSIRITYTHAFEDYLFPANLNLTMEYFIEGEEKKTLTSMYVGDTREIASVSIQLTNFNENTAIATFLITEIEEPDISDSGNVFPPILFPNF